jgi:hypothetical protein
MNKNRLTIYLDEKLIAKIKHLAIDERKSLSEYLESLIKGVVNK